MTLKVGVIGLGNVGLALGNSLQLSGHKVKYGTRDVNSDKLKNLREKVSIERLPSVDATSNAEAVDWADIIILAIPGAKNDKDLDEMAELVKAAAGKPVLDATNPLSDSFEIRWAEGTSAGEELQRRVGDAVPVYKCFNTIGARHMVDPTMLAGPHGVTMLYAGPADHAAAVDRVVRDAGFQPFRVGPIRYARNLEALAELWIHLAVPPIPSTNVKIPDGMFAFNLLRKAR